MAGSAARQSGVSVATSASSLSAGPPSGKGASAVAAIRKARASGSYAGDAATSDDADEFLAILTGSNITYLAPERLNFAPSSKACDMWSYGCLVYFMCSGKLPWLQMKTMKEVRGVVLFWSCGGALLAPSHMSSLSLSFAVTTTTTTTSDH